MTTRILLASLLFALTLSPLARAQEHEVGGPLAGVKLPLYKTHHGEPAGYPGSIPELAEKHAGETQQGYGLYTPQGNQPELELYPGSVEHYRTYWHKYCPVRFFFDRQSQVKNFLAKDLPGVPADRVEDYAEPVYWVGRFALAQNTGYVNDPVPVVRCGVGEPVLKLDLGTLKPGLYAVRVIGAVETAKVRPFREPLFVTLRINDGPGGETNTYRLRVGYCDEFYSVCEIYFHAGAERAYEAELFVDERSAVDLLVHNISLDDALAGTELRAVKDRPVLHAPPTAVKPSTYTPQERLKRDAALWTLRPRLNAQPLFSDLSRIFDHSGLSKNVTIGYDGMTIPEIEAKWGRWQYPTFIDHFGRFNDDPNLHRVLVRNEKLDLVYTLDDLAAGRPLPDPYPFKDDGAGLYQPDPDDPGKGSFWGPVVDGVNGRLRYHRQCAMRIAEGGARAWVEQGDADRAHDGAVALARYAYDFPAADPANAIMDLVRAPGPYNRDSRCRRRDTTYMNPGIYYYKVYVGVYDKLFSYIQGNRQLAESVGRFVPWVRTPEDVIALIDTYLIQTTAKRLMRYNYYRGGATSLLPLVMVLDDNDFTQPWMQWLFTRTYAYPYPPVGLQDYVIDRHARDGMSMIGSHSYAVQSAREAEAIAKYVDLGGDPQYDLRDPKRYPKPLASALWPIRTAIAGMDFIRQGDVGGPDKYYGRPLLKMGQINRDWRWTGDARLAYIIKHYPGRGDLSDAEWAAVQRQAATVKRAPWMDQTSRVVANWAGILTSGTQHDDWRFRRSAYVRVGEGWGHNHYDTLDLQVHALGLPMTIDGGQRGGYSEPGDRNTRVHNMVEVDGEQYYGHSWVRTLSDMPGARYLRAEGTPLRNVTLYRRQVALIDVSEGEGSLGAPLSPEQAGPKRLNLPAKVTPATSYVFDCFRVAGGNAHSYCFHAMVNDELTWNAENVVPPAQAPEADRAYLGFFGRGGDASQVGDCPENLVATWRYRRDKNEANQRGAEPDMLLNVYDPEAPRTYTRLHLAGVGGDRAFRSKVVCHHVVYEWEALMARRTAEQPIESAYAAIIEPYAGEPFIASVKRLDIADNDTDARQAVAVAVRTTNGHTDLCFADGRPDRTREVGAVKIAGEFAYLSTDTQGLRQASLSGGTRLDAANVAINADTRERTGTVLAADYLNKQIVIDADWPACDTDRQVEIGTLPVVSDAGRPGYVTSYTAQRIEPLGDGRTRITFHRGADYFRTRLKAMDPETNTVTGVLGLVLEQGDMTGLDKHWVASNDDMTAFWRADVLPSERKTASYPFKLHGPRIAEDSFGDAGALRLWEYGVGDRVRMSTYVTVRRTEAGAYDVESDVDATVRIGNTTATLKAERMPVAATLK